MNPNSPNFRHQDMNQYEVATAALNVLCRLIEELPYANTVITDLHLDIVRSCVDAAEERYMSGN